MAESAELLRRVPVFTDLPDDQVAWFLRQSQDLTLKAGDTYSRQDDPADAMFVLLDGEFQARGELAGETLVLPLKAGDVTGLLPFSRMKRFRVSGRATTEARLLRFPASLFPDLVQKMPELVARLVGLMSDRIRERRGSNSSRTGSPHWANFQRAWPTNSTILPPLPDGPRVNCATF